MQKKALPTPPTFKSSHTCSSPLNMSDHSQSLEQRTRKRTHVKMHQRMQQPTTFFLHSVAPNSNFFIDFFLISFVLLEVLFFCFNWFWRSEIEEERKISSCPKKILFHGYSGIKKVYEGDNSIWVYFFEGWPSKWLLTVMQKRRLNSFGRRNRDLQIRRMINHSFKVN